MSEKKLTIKEADFVKQYIIDFNATQAAIRANYSEKTARQIAAQLLSKLNIQAGIKEELDKRAQRLEVSQDRIVMELMKIAFSDINNYTDAQGKVDISDPNVSCVVREYKEKVTYAKDSEGEAQPTIEKEVKLYDKLKAMELLGKHLAMFTDNVTQKIEIKEDVKVSFD
jgi:phage terminase small subunit